MNLIGLNQLIKRSGFQKKYVARKSGITQVELSHIIKGRRKPKPETLEKILKTITQNEPKEGNKQ